MAGKVWFPKEFTSEEKQLKKLILAYLKVTKYDCVYDLKMQTTVHLPNKHFTDITIYINEPIYIAYLLSGGVKLEVLVKRNLKSQYPINIKLIKK